MNNSKFKSVLLGGLALLALCAGLLSQTSTNSTSLAGTLTLSPADEQRIVNAVLARLTNSVITLRGTNITFTLTPK